VNQRPSQILRQENLLDDIEPGVWDLLLDAKILERVTPEGAKGKNANNETFLKDDIEKQYERFERLEANG
jgi:hypothetical protein